MYIYIVIWFKIHCLFTNAQQLKFCFTGTFQSVQYVDVVGPVADNKNPFVMHQQIIHSVPLKFSGNADPSVVKKQPAYNPG